MAIKLSAAFFSPRITPIPRFSLHTNAVCTRRNDQMKQARERELFSERLHRSSHATRIDIFLLRPRYFFRVFALNREKRKKMHRNAAPW
ncbi:hypothetical protein GNZ12_31905 [Paraburkholderia sp. 1N]|uniref:Uncharacterized protein n=1 Tax=Paraburkholderia solitsugae TaxID=2675748 RepID=A0ABX2BWF3_9BURK|nr:hypothetical protein [Paraburkholderia solitsugae]NPT44130.1 hypothetical protein [Paraburkholderia solitsugae]NPT45841.1 hypothetical protein [Paraburkholderia solitsugae]